jgi:hypothetical protein
VACTLDNGKLLCLYRSGAIAVTIDAAGKGSIMDPKGKCVMVISDESSAVDRSKGLVAKVLDKRGNCVNSYDQFGSPSKNKASTALVSDTEASPSKRGNSNNGGASVGKTTHVWRHEGLHIEFDPSTWDLKVLMNTESFSCSFSSLFGVDLASAGSVVAVSVSGGASTSGARVQAINGPIKGKNSNRRPDHSSGVTSSDRGSNREGSDIEESPAALRPHNGADLNHASVRTGVQSVVSQLDDMLSGMKLRQRALN